MSNSPESTNTAASHDSGAWTPLTQPTFRALWLAILVGNIGTWINDIAASWVMTENTGSPFMVAMVQSASTVPVVLLAIIAGTLADIVDRRKYLIVAQFWMLLVATLIATFSHLGWLTPWVLVALTFCMGIGAAMAMPAQQATTPELVPRSMLGAAVALGSLSMNIARAIGPALGGFIVARWGVTWAFSLNAVSFLGVMAVLIWWHRQPSESKLPPEHFTGALRAGLRYAMQASVLQAVLIRAACFFVFASALTAMLPIVVKQELHASAGTYGLLLGCIGIGAIAGALLLPKIREKVNADHLVFSATMIYAGCMMGLALVRNMYALYLISLINGFAWISVLSSLQVAAQTSVPGWVRARALALYIVVFSAGMATGSLVWGAVAQRFTTSLALIVAAVCAVVAALLTVRFQMRSAAQVNVTPSGHWPQPIVTDEVEGDRGPVLVTIEYKIALDRRTEFLEIMQTLGHSRRRDGAIQWGVMEDTTQPGDYMEYFVTSSWLDHLRQHERVTQEEQKLQTQLLALHTAGASPQIRHFVGGRPIDTSVRGIQESAQGPHLV